MKHSQVRTTATCESASDIAKRFNVSLATAYRHLRRGTLPTEERRIGLDGKWYPATTGNSKVVSAVRRELDLARQALKRADDKACDSGIDAGDLSALREILQLAQNAVTRWENSK